MTKPPAKILRPLALAALAALALAGCSRKENEAATIDNAANAEVTTPAVPADNTTVGNAGATDTSADANVTANATAPTGSIGRTSREGGGATGAAGGGTGGPG